MKARQEPYQLTSYKIASALSGFDPRQCNSGTNTEHRYRHIVGFKGRLLERIILDQPGISRQQLLERLRSTIPAGEIHDYLQDLLADGRIQMTVGDCERYWGPPNGEVQ